MPSLSKNQFQALGALFIVFTLFVLATYGAQRYHDALVGMVYLSGGAGMVLYVFITVMTVVIAPLSSFPLIPVATSLWGVGWTAVLSIVGWTTGSMIAFFLSRKYGIRLLEKFISLEKIEAVRRVIPSENIFWTVVLLRMSMPVDILSYALGLFSSLGWRKYLLATLVGVTPFAFLFAYAGTLPLRYQVIGFGIGLLLVIWIQLRKR
jgi:uncharacterized membrane protein YdjX (TVP38/TMEM64 family)